MNISSEIKYQLWDFKKSVAVFYTVIFLVYIFLATLVSINTNSNVSINGGEIASLIFLFIMGLNSFKNNFGFLISNGRSRKKFFLGFLVSASILAAFMSTVDNIISFLLPDVYSFSIYNLAFARGDLLGAVHFAQGILWTFSLYITIVMTGFLITVLYYRMGKIQKLAFSIGVPSFFIFIFPYIDGNFFNWKISKAIGHFFSATLGFADGINPYKSMIFFILVAVILSGLVYLPIRKAPIKD